MRLVEEYGRLREEEQEIWQQRLDNLHRVLDDEEQLRILQQRLYDMQLLEANVRQQQADGEQEDAATPQELAELQRRGDQLRQLEAEVQQWEVNLRQQRDDQQP